MDKFWKPFIKQVEEKEGIERAKFTTQELDETCPKCGEHKLQIKIRQNGSFCCVCGYPECSYTRNVNETAEEAAERIAKAEAEQAELNGRECPKCGRSPSVQIQPNRQQIHRLRQLSEMQTRRAAGKTERYRRPMPAMQKRQPRRAQIPLR